jgi:hypothetical protein
MSTEQAKPVEEPSTLGGRIFRRIVCALTAGFVYPNAFIEGMDMTRAGREAVDRANK